MKKRIFFFLPPEKKKSLFYDKAIEYLNYFCKAKFSIKENSPLIS
jgi:hypothetical protein